MLALEAECQRNPSNAEAWRLLGTVQAENDDDQQAIAAMNRCVVGERMLGETHIQQFPVIRPTTMC